MTFSGCRYPQFLPVHSELTLQDWKDITELSLGNFFVMSMYVIAAVLFYVQVQRGVQNTRDVDVHSHVLR